MPPPPPPVDIRYPAELPITGLREEILDALARNQVVVVAGETGSGKSTQLPKLCLEAGLATDGLIGHTQPRRIAARAVAERVAEELGESVGGLVGYTVRFTDRVGDDTRIKVMTDGILLGELQRDRKLRRYQTLIIDEAHERSLNIDFLLGYLKQLLPQRPDLKVIVTSATIDTARFSEHFEGAPIIEVSGRTYPVEVRYRPLTAEDGEEEDRDQTQAIIDAVEELSHEPPGDVLVFLSGEREIRDTSDALARLDLPNTELLPLYARLSSADQHRVFQPHTSRRIVLATNVAETSLTVPGVRYVVDPGTARISRYSRRTKVQRLPIEAISQASANQRAGRCGRVAPGVCIRLYSEDDFASRPEFTEAEILRTNLASVILQMAAIGLGDIAAFPFVDAPDARAIKDGVASLEELGALDPNASSDRKRLTPLGRQLAQIPLDPRFGRMLLEAHRNGCLHDVMVIAAALSIQDPRENPLGKEEAAAQAHARFAVPDSDFLGYVKLWDHLRAARHEAKSSSQFRKLCKNEFLNYLRVREWQDLYSQLRFVAHRMNMRPNTDAASATAIHRSLLAGLLSHIGMRRAESNEFLGARSTKFLISNRSRLSKKPPKWVVAAELVETNRTWAGVVARIQPEWAEQLGAHLVKRSYTDPWWDPRRGAAMTNERVTLYGLPIVGARQVPYSRVDAIGARDVFIREALVEGDWETHHNFVGDNQKVLDEVRALHQRTRRHDVLVTDAALFDFYDERIPPDVTSGRHFDNWWKRVRGEDPDLLVVRPEDLLPAEATVDVSAFPDTWRYDDLDLPLSYEFEAASDRDGVTVSIPISVLERIDPSVFSWQVPGLRDELVTSLLRSLPKAVRKEVGPAPDVAQPFVAAHGPSDGDLGVVLAAVVTDVAGFRVLPDEFDFSALPAYLRMTFRIVNDRGDELVVGKDLPALRKRLAPSVRAAVAKSVPHIEQSGLTAWSFGELPQVVAVGASGALKGYPALVDEGTSVGIRIFSTPDEQRRAMWGGTRRLLLLTVPPPARAVDRAFSNQARLAVAQLPLASLGEVVRDCIEAAVDDLMRENGGPVWDATAFDALRGRVKGDLPRRAADLASAASRVLIAAGAIRARTDRLTAPSFDAAVLDIRAQIARLAGSGFVTRAGRDRMDDVLRYLHAIDRRLDKLADDVARDARLMRTVSNLEEDADRLRSRAPEAAADVGWLIEELRVSLWAQHLGTRVPVSEKRVLQLIEEAFGASG